MKRITAGIVSWMGAASRTGLVVLSVGIVALSVLLGIGVQHVAATNAQEQLAEGQWVTGSVVRVENEYRSVAGPYTRVTGNLKKDRDVIAQFAHGEENLGNEDLAVGDSVTRWQHANGRISEAAPSLETASALGLVLPMPILAFLAAGLSIARYEGRRRTQQ